MTKFDPTTNRIQFGLLAPEEKEVMRGWPHGWEYYSLSDERWYTPYVPAWDSNITYRCKPVPVTVTTYLAIFDNGDVGFTFRSYEEAFSNGFPSGNLVGVLRIDITNGVLRVKLVGG
jgi:hypothetical protein